MTASRLVAPLHWPEVVLQVFRLVTLSQARMFRLVFLPLYQSKSNYQTKWFLHSLGPEPLLLMDRNREPGGLLDTWQDFLNTAAGRKISLDSNILHHAPTKPDQIKKTKQN